MSKFLKIEIFRIGLENFKTLLKKLYFLTVKNKLSTGDVVKMLHPNVDFKKHSTMSKLRHPKKCYVQEIGSF